MQDWEFLLQKEGDRSWLPLESPTVEILEGRYRVVAQSRRENAAVEIRIVHQSIEDDPPKRRLQTRSAQTNDRGLVVVMPYTHLQPGRWELRAQGDLMADMLGESWQATVELQVFAQEADWEWPEPTARSPGAALSDWKAASEAAPLQEAAAIVQAIALQAEALQTEARSSESLPQPEIAAATSRADVSIADRDRSLPVDRHREANVETVIDAAIASPTQPAPTAQQDAQQATQQDLDSVADALNEAPLREPDSIATSELQINLPQTSFVARPGELLQLRGLIDGSGVSTSGLMMEVILRDPQQSQILADLREALPTQTLPLPFECAIEIPDREQTHLLLGELSIATATGAIVARRSFTVTIALEQLLATLNGDLPDADWLQPPLQFAEATPPDLNLALLNLVGTPQPQPQPPLQPSSSPALPPQLLKSEPTRAPKPLQLPFADRKRPSPAEVEIQVAQRSSAPDSIPLERPSAAPSEIVETIAPLASEPLAIDLPADLPLDLMMPSDPIRSPLAPPARCEDAAFRSLNLQQRFWSRLNSLASDEERSDWLGDAASELGSRPARSLSERPVDAQAAQEFVVEDEHPTRSQRHSSSGKPLEPPESMVISDEEAIPTPQIEVASGELTAGSALSVRVKLPDLTPRIYVKLWLRDAQLRSLLDGPRWLVDFLPDGHGNLEARLALTVPYGCVELQFEAIAVEMATQRESHKSIVLRSVVPPDLSVMSIDLDF